nr:hypothetical protein [Bathymodiolus platifrons methanotrophic gill symbiont]
MKSGKNAQNIQRYRCKNSACQTQTFMLYYLNIYDLEELFYSPYNRLKQGKFGI